MVWLLAEILAFVLAAALFGGLMGLGLAAATTKRRSVDLEREHRSLGERLLGAERAHRALEAKSAARAAAEGAARGELERRIREAEHAAAEFRARAEAAERRLRAADEPAGQQAPVIEAVVLTSEAAENAELESLRALLDTAEAARGKAELALRQAEAERDAAQTVAAAAEADAAERARQGQEIESLRAQLAAAERMRAKSEADLATAQARAQEVMRSAALLMAQAGVLPGIAPGAPAPAASPAASAPAANLPGERPPPLPAPRGGRADDLRRIRGIGLKLEGVLNGLGLFHYEQIAALTPANVQWLEAHLKASGRIAREDWIGQARALSAARGREDGKVHPSDAGA
jgi:predicted flap endonuclease-1-like 5' DNA nuclease